MKKIGTRHKLFKKAVSLIVAAAFISNFIITDAWAGVDAGKPPYSVKAASSPQYATVDVETFSIPSHLGEIKDLYHAEGGKIVIHIQDAHCNVFAQKKISEIIDYLNKEYGVRVLNLEGGAGDYDLRVFTSITGEAIRAEVADYFVKKGELNGAELYAINNPDKVNLWGVEDKDLYLANLKVYRDSLSYRPEVDKELKSIGSALDNLKRAIYTPEIMRIDTAYTSYKSGAMSFRDYLGFLAARAKETGVKIDDFKDIALLDRSIVAENSIDFKKANGERDTLIEELKRGLSMNEMRDLVNKTVDFKAAKLSRGNFYAFLVKRAKAMGLDMRKYPALAAYIEYISAYESVNRSMVMKELDALESAVKDKLYKNDTQRALNGLSRNLSLLNNIFSITLTKTDYRYYEANKDAFRSQNFVKFIEREAPKYKIQASFDGGMSELDKRLEEISKFYDYSFQRDKVFLKNMRFGEGQDGSKTAILMTGGFHTENLCDLLEKENISYVSVVPRFTSSKNYKPPYFEILAGESFGIEGMLKSVIAQASNLQVASHLTSLGDAVWGASGQYAFKAAVYILARMREGKQVEITGLDGKILTAGGAPLVFGDKGTKLSMTLAALKTAVGYTQEAETTGTDDDTNTPNHFTGNIAAGFTELELDGLRANIGSSSDNIKKSNEEAVGAVVKASGRLLERSEEIEKMLTESGVNEARAAAVFGAILDPAGEFMWFETIVAGPEKYLLGQESALAADMVNYLTLQERESGVKGLVDEYVLHEALERSGLKHAEIIDFTTKFFGRGRMGIDFARPGETPLGKVLRGFIQWKLSKIGAVAPPVTVRGHVDENAKWTGLEGLSADMNSSLSPKEMKQFVTDLIQTKIRYVVNDAEDLTGRDYGYMKITGFKYIGFFGSKTVIVVDAKTDKGPVKFAIRLLVPRSVPDKDRLGAETDNEVRISRLADLGASAVHGARRVYYINDDFDPALSTRMRALGVFGYTVGDPVEGRRLDSLEGAKKAEAYEEAVKSVVNVWLLNYSLAQGEDPRQGKGLMMDDLRGENFIKNEGTPGLNMVVQLNLGSLKAADLDTMKKNVVAWVTSELGILPGSADETRYEKVIIETFREFIVSKGSSIDAGLRAAIATLPMYQRYAGIGLADNEIEDFLGRDPGLLSKTQLGTLFDEMKPKILTKSQLSGKTSVTSKGVTYDFPAILKTATGTYTIKEKLGAGGYGIVFKALASDGREVAIKFLLPTAGRRGKVDLLREYLFMRKLDDVPGVVKAYEAGYYTTTDTNGNRQDNAFTILELVTGGSLRDQLIDRKAQGQGYTDDEIIQCSREIFTALNECHKRGIFHRDIKPDNILIGADRKLKLSDFGLSLYLPKGKADTGVAGFAGTPHYISSQSYWEGKVTPKTDVFAAGFTLSELRDGNEPHVMERNMRKLIWSRSQDPRIMGAKTRAIIELVGERFKVFGDIRKDAVNNNRKDFLGFFIASLLIEDLCVTNGRIVSHNSMDFKTPEAALKWMDWKFGKVTPVAQTAPPAAPAAKAAAPRAPPVAQPAAAVTLPEWMNAFSLLANAFGAEAGWVKWVTRVLTIFSTPVHELGHLAAARAAGIEVERKGMFTGSVSLKMPTPAVYYAGVFANLAVAAISAALLLYLDQPLSKIGSIALISIAVSNLASALAELIGLPFGIGDLAEARKKPEIELVTEKPKQQDETPRPETGYSGRDGRERAVWSFEEEDTSTAPAPKLNISIAPAPYNATTEKKKFDKCTSQLAMAKNTLEVMPGNKLLTALGYASGIDDLSWDKLSKSVALSYYAESQDKHIFKVEFKTLGGTSISISLAGKKEMRIGNIDDHEGRDLSILGTQPMDKVVPWFAGQYEDKDTRLWFLKEFVEGETAAQLKARGALTDEIKRNIVDTLFKIIFRLNGVAPCDIRLENFVIPKGTNNVIMMDLGNKRFRAMTGEGPEKHQVLIVSALIASLGSTDVNDPQKNEWLFDAIANNILFGDDEGMNFLKMTAEQIKQETDFEMSGTLVSHLELYPDLKDVSFAQLVELTLKGLEGYISRVTTERLSKPPEIPLYQRTLEEIMEANQAPTAEQVPPLPIDTIATNVTASAPLKTANRGEIKRELDEFVDAELVGLGMSQENADSLKRVIDTVYLLGEGKWRGDNDEYDMSGEVKWHDFTHVGNNTLETMRAMTEQAKGVEGAERAAYLKAIFLTGVAGIAHDVGYYREDADGFGTIKVGHEQRSKDFIMTYGDRLGITDEGDRAGICLIIAGTEASVGASFWKKLERSVNENNADDIELLTENIVPESGDLRNVTKPVMDKVIVGAKLLASLDILDTREDAVEAMDRLRDEFARDKDKLKQWLDKRNIDALAVGKLLKIHSEIQKEIREGRLPADGFAAELKKRAAEREVSLDNDLKLKAVIELGKLEPATARTYEGQVKGTVFFYNGYALPRVKALGVWDLVSKPKRGAFDLTKEMVTIANEAERASQGTLDVNALRAEAIKRIQARPAQKAAKEVLPAAELASPATASDTGARAGLSGEEIQRLAKELLLVAAADLTSRVLPGTPEHRGAMYSVKVRGFFEEKGIPIGSSDAKNIFLEAKVRAVRARNAENAVIEAKLNVSSQVDSAKAVIGDFRQNRTDIVIMPGSEIFEAQQAGVAGDTARKLHKSYGQETLPFSYAYKKEMMTTGEWKKGLKFLLSDRVRKAFDAAKDGNKNPRILMYLPITQLDRVNIFDKGGVLEDVADIKDLITIVSEAEIPEDGVIDNVMHIVLAKALLNYERYQKGDFGAEAKMGREQLDRLMRFLETLTKPGSIDFKEYAANPAELINKILSSDIMLRMMKIDFSEIKDWKAAQDEVLRSL